MPAQYKDKESLALIREKLWERAKSSGITLADVQDRTNFSYSQVYRLLRGKNNFSFSHFIAVCKALEVQPLDILNFEISLPKYPPVRRVRKQNS
ncbi:helix-turn-helix transcriptional regulator [Mucilaginibacter sabulilitoris]|uniref:Helix-turn-helix transcriptional regulator n=1 Tax=Mucilaginibacter sabulilitoris TaxID=1173583 RepID=A0ABZ0TS73_9SPHI|nr:helix-turn-helix transcriptional regulator [Mucilaginibacter sabulilitoris]WPU95757.1 helix-turn-helix transcriptional regulator [Mucilaginibacter sabulilitoris]